VLVNLLLTLLLYLPGLLHAWYIVYKYEEDPFYDIEKASGDDDFARKRKESEVFHAPVPPSVVMVPTFEADDLVDLGLEEEKARRQSYAKVARKRSTPTQMAVPEPALRRNSAI